MTSCGLQWRTMTPALFSRREACTRCRVKSCFTIEFDRSAKPTSGKAAKTLRS